MISSIRRLGLLAAFVAIGSLSLAVTDDQQIQISRALNSPTLAVKYSGVHASLVELRLNGESFGTRSVDEAAANGETTFSLDVLALKDGDNDVEIRLYDDSGHLVGTEKTVITADQTTKSPIFLTTPKVGDNVMGPVEITVGFGRDFKNSYVSFFIDNQFKAMMNFPPFTYVWDTSREANGWHELEAWVVDDTSATFKTRKVRVFVNNPGGHTYRIMPPASKPAAKPASKPVYKPAKVVPVLPEPVLDLTASPNSVAAPISGMTAPLKPIAQATSVLSVAKTTALPPAVLGFVAQNGVRPHLEGHSSDVKAAPMPPSVATSARVMTPTGKRFVAAKPVPSTQVAKPAVIQAKPVESVTPSVAEVRAAAANPVAADVKATPAQPKILAVTSPVPSSVSRPSTVVAPSMPVVPAVQKTSPVAEPKPAALDQGTLLALAPATRPEVVATNYKPLVLDMTGEGMVARPHTIVHPATPVLPKPIVSAQPAVTEAAMTSLATTDSVIRKPAPAKPAAKPTHHAKLITVEYGTKLPIHSDYEIVYAGKALSFDVAPTIHQGVPVTPFRHLIEHAGGDVNWEAADKEIQASTDGRDIWLKIGDRIAKINTLSVELELAPYIQAGRTIVPLSFIKSALNVDIDYDKATGHVLITPKK